MIIKKIPNPKTSGSKSARTAGLLNYIAALEVTNGIDYSDGADHEKCIHFEAANFVSENLQTQIKEMTALASVNTKSKNPIDHWMISWRSDENPTVDQAREAIDIFIKHVNLKGHQIVWGLHKDTDHMHVHIAVNRIHPVTEKCIEINNRFGYAEAHKALAKIEHAQGWKPAAGALFEVMNGKVVAKTHDGKEQEIKTEIIDKELQTGEKSVLRICKERAAPIIKNAKSWAELHAGLEAQGFKFERFGSGSKIHYGDISVKASDVDRAASIASLQKKLGPYQPQEEIKSNDYSHHTSNTVRTGSGAIIAANKPDIAQTPKKPANGLRTLSERSLAHDKSWNKLESTGVLFIVRGSDNREPGGLRRPSRRDPEPLKSNQPGWTEYQAIRAERRKDKDAELLAQRKQHEADKDKLYAAHTAYREDKLNGMDWSGKGIRKNLLSSVIATQQAAEKLQLQERQKEERDALHARYVPLPQYKAWQQQPRLLAPVAAMAHSSKHPERLSSVVLALTHTEGKRGIAYQDKGQELFIDQGRTLAIVQHEQQTLTQIAAALSVAQQKYGVLLTVTGPDEFKRRAVQAAVKNNLIVKFADPAMENLRLALIEANRQAAQEVIKAPQDAAKAAAAEAAPIFGRERDAAQAKVAAQTAPIQDKPDLTPALVSQDVKSNQLDDATHVAVADAAPALLELKREAADLVRNGFYVGLVLDVTDGVVTQKINREGATVRHAVARLSAELAIGTVAEIAYKDGVGNVAVKDLGKGIGG